jgi:uncharacterized protein (TIGR02271 family)
MDTRIRKGMTVRSTSGLSLGTVIDLGRESFIVEKGAFFPKNHELRSDCVAEIRGDEILYRLAQDVSETARTNGWQKTELAEGNELRMPLMEEQILVEKEIKETGAVRVHKNVIIEERNITVPIRSEEVIVEHLPAARAGTAAAHAFEDERYSIPVHEEEFRVQKRPVVKEEVRVRRVSHEEQRSATASLRHEELEVEDETRIERARLESEKKEV